MPVNQTSNNQIQTDVISKYNIQKKQQKDKQSQQQTQQKETTERNNPSEDVRVTLTRQGRSKTASRTENTANVETRQRTQENRNLESKQAIQAYQNANKAAENTRPENTRQRQISRIVG